MGVGAGIFLVAVGAIFKYAITAEVSGVDINTIGAILMIAGIAVTALSLVLILAARGRGDRVVESRRRTTTDTRL
jgi:hypothetical protein